MGFLKRLLGKASVEVSDEQAKKIGAKFEDMTGKVMETKTSFDENDRPVPVWEKPVRRKGLSYGSEMDLPNEENQFNFGGTYQEYFEMIFAEDFPEFEVSKQISSSGRDVIYTFTSNGEKRLVIEILHEGASVNKLRNDCKAQGMPYLRFYYNHDGWWNTRSYVRDRIRKAVG